MKQRFNFNTEMIIAKKISDYWYIDEHESLKKWTESLKSWFGNKKMFFEDFLPPKLKFFLSPWFISTWFESALSKESKFAKKNRKKSFEFVLYERRQTSDVTSFIAQCSMWSESLQVVGLWIVGKTFQHARTLCKYVWVHFCLFNRIWFSKKKKNENCIYHFVI